MNTIAEHPWHVVNLVRAKRDQMRFSTIELPDEGRRERLRVGQWAKLYFTLQDAPQGEWMWVEITARTWAGRVRAYTGKLVNTPSVVKGVRLWDEVMFTSDDVADWDDPEEQVS